MPAAAIPYVRRRGERFYLNLPIPVDLRRRFRTRSGQERTHVVASLGTADSGEAQRRATALKSRWELWFQGLRADERLEPSSGPPAFSEPVAATRDGNRLLRPQDRFTSYRYLAFKLAGIANSLTRGASRVYKATFGMSGLEWGVMAMLATHPDTSAANICRWVGLDKGAASRAVARLVTLGLVRDSDRQGGGRARLLCLSAKGLALHDRILVVAGHRESLLTASLSRAETALLAELLDRLWAQLDVVNAYRPEATRRD